jgi:hypothetical protein
MNEKEKQSFRLVFEFLEKWRGTVIETDEQWKGLADDVGQLGADLDIDHNPLGWRLMIAALDYFNDLYQNGMKPMPARYFGRDDFEH